MTHRPPQRVPASERSPDLAPRHPAQTVAARAGVAVLWLGLLAGALAQLAPPAKPVLLPTRPGTVQHTGRSHPGSLLTTTQGASRPPESRPR